MIQNEEMPIGFTMELAQHSDALLRFSNMSRERQQAIIEGARTVNSKQEMKGYVRDALNPTGGGLNGTEKFFYFGA